MCGIVGIVGNLDKRHTRAFKELLYMDKLRGKDSTGVFAVDKDMTASVCKRALEAPDFLAQPRYTRHITEKKVALVGHNRAATQGAVNDANAHPFISQNSKIVGVHNGTCDKKDMPSSWKDTYFDTDSETIFNALASSSETIKGSATTLSKLIGAYGLVWFDNRDNTLNISRNTERPLFIATSKVEGSWFAFASCQYMLQCALERNHLDWGDLRLLTEGFVSKFFLESVKDSKFPDTWKTHKFTIAERPKLPVTTGRRSGNGWKNGVYVGHGDDDGDPWGDYGAYGHGSYSHSPTRSDLDISSVTPEIVINARFQTIKDRYNMNNWFPKNPRDVVMDDKAQEEYLKDKRCACCGAEDLKPDSGFVTFRPDIVVCGDCVKNDEVINSTFRESKEVA